MRFAGAGVLVMAMTIGAHAETRPELSLPIDCEAQKTCFIQSYVDIDAGSGARDYACGTATYNSHSGIDFRLMSAAEVSKSVAVLASADGTVKGLRDGVSDIFFSDNKDKSVAGRECGNGVVIDHGDGWETQYCHMKQGSVAVKTGQAVRRGERLGVVGYSGMADFAHVHLTVRRNGAVVDPFSPDATAGACQRDPRGAGLWKADVAVAFPYRQGQIISVGLAGEPPQHAALEKDHTAIVRASSDGKALLVYGRFINLSAGDRLRFSLAGPGGALIASTLDPLERSKATYTAYAGKKRTAGPWPPGTYTGTVELIRDGVVVGTNVVSEEVR